MSEEWTWSHTRDLREMETAEPPGGGLLWQAAAEIERLRAALAWLAAEEIIADFEVPEDIRSTIDAAHTILHEQVEAAREEGAELVRETIRCCLLDEGTPEHVDIEALELLDRLCAAAEEEGARRAARRIRKHQCVCCGEPSYPTLICAKCMGG